MKKFQEYSRQLNLSDINKEMLGIWDEHRRLGARAARRA